MTVKIYSPPSDAMSPPVTEGFVTDFVLASDYMELQRKVEALQTLNEALAVDSREMKRCGKSLLVEATSVYRLYNKTQQPDGNIVDEQALQELSDAIHSTFATDAAIAEIEARGVERFVKEDVGSPYADGAGETYQDGFNRAIEITKKKALKFAQQLRKESGE